MVVLGTRPEAIKLCPLINELLLDGKFDIITCSTGQHKEMLSQVLDLFGVKSDYDLDVMSKCKSLNSLTSLILKELEPIIDIEKPNAILVQGDTTSALCGGLSAFYNKIQVIHLEAGLRTNDIYSPFPEEVNRKIISTFTSIHLCPTSLNKENLIAEGVDEDKIFITGNTVIDSLFYISKKLRENEELRTKTLNSLHKKLNNCNLQKDIVLVTSHRRENLGKGIDNICQSLIEISSKLPNVNIIFPIHLNPKIQNLVRSKLDSVTNIYLCNPLDYIEFNYLMSISKLVISDSGGIQEEAPSLGKPVLVTREETERQEAVEAGTVRLVGTSIEKIVKETLLLFKNKDEYDRMSAIKNPYGIGNSVILIKQILINNLKD